MFLFNSSSSLEENVDDGLEGQQGQEVSQLCEEEGAEDVPDGSQDGGECLSDSDGLDVNKIFKDWQQLKEGHKLERKCNAVAIVLVIIALCAPIVSLTL